VELETQYVGIDLHRRRSVIVRRNGAGETLDTVRIDNDPVVLAAELAKAGEHPEVILEATYGWYWAADVIQECGGNVHLAHPLGNNWGNRRVKNDERDATDLVDLLRLGRLAEAWIAPPPLRELREHIRYRAKLVHFRTNLKSQIHAVLAKEGVAVPMTDLFGVGGQRLLDEVHLGDAYRVRVESLRNLIEHSTARSPCSKSRPPLTSLVTSATTLCRPFPASARCWLRYSWPRSGTSQGSRAPAISAAGPG
jgi:transposase